MSIAEFILASGVMGAIFVTLQQLAVWGIKRRAEKKDNAKQDMAACVTDVHNMMAEMITSQKVILHDRIKWLSAGYLQKGEVDLSSREDLIEMHKVYQAHGGNGNLNRLMEMVLQLPLKDIN